MFLNINEKTGSIFFLLQVYRIDNFEKNYEIQEDKKIEYTMSNNYQLLYTIGIWAKSIIKIILLK